MTLPETESSADIESSPEHQAALIYAAGEALAAGLIPYPWIEGTPLPPTGLTSSGSNKDYSPLDVTPVHQLPDLWDQQAVAMREESAEAAATVILCARELRASLAAVPLAEDYVLGTKASLEQMRAQFRGSLSTDPLLATP